MSNAVVPFEHQLTLADAIAKSGMFGIRTRDQALVLMALCESDGLHPVVACRDYDIIAGRPAKKSEAMMRDFLRSGGKVEWHALNDTEAAATFSHPQGGSVRIDWDMKRAAMAGLAAKETWKKFPRSMLRSRCVSEGIRTIYPMATGGMYVPDEAADIGDTKPMRDVTPAKPARDLASELDDFAGKPEAPPTATAETPHDPVTGEITGEITGDADLPEYYVPLGTVNGAPNWATWCAAMKNMYMAATDDDMLGAIAEANSATLAELASGGNGGRKAADKLRALFQSRHLELARMAAAQA